MHCYASFLLVLFVVQTGCATPAPKALDYYQDAPVTNIGLAVDLDLLATAKLSQERKQEGANLLRFYHRTETSLENYIEQLEHNIGANEQLREKYATTEAFVGAVGGFSSPAIIFATAAVAVPIAAAVWIVTGQIIQAQDVKPEIAEAGKRLEDAHRLEHLLPDIVTAYRGLTFADSETEAERRFKQWASYIENLRTKVTHFFTEDETHRKASVRKQ
jgi:hypothetical protein